MRWFFRATAVMAIALAFAGSALFLRSGHAADANVTIVNFAFNPGEVAIDVGDTVTWTNTGSTHTVTDNGGAFDSGNIPNGGQFARTYNQAGSFPYRCTIHPFMQGTILVGGGGAPTATPTTPPTDTPTPTATPTEPGATNTPTATATPTNTPLPTATPTPPGNGETPETERQAVLPGVAKD